jgi:hypothetical protein
MLAKSKWSLVLNFTVFSTLAWSAEIPHFDGLGFSGSLEAPEEVLAYVKAAPGKNKLIAEKGFNFALKDITRINAGASWGSVAKHCTDSLLFYPMGKTFLLCVEAQLKHGNEIRQKKQGMGKTWTRPFSGFERIWKEAWHGSIRQLYWSHLSHRWKQANANDYSPTVIVSKITWTQEKPRPSVRLCNGRDFEKNGRQICAINHDIYIQNE